MRYLLGALAGFSASERVAPEAMPELERYVLHRLAETDSLVREAAAAYDFHSMFTVLHNLFDVSAVSEEMQRIQLYSHPHSKFADEFGRFGYAV